MSNQLLTISMITQEALMVLENECTFTSCVTKEYDDQFARTGAKIGATVNVRLPARFIGTTGPALAVESFVENSRPVTLTTQFHVDTSFNEQDLTLSMDMFSKRVLKPAIATIANKVDRDGLVLAKNSIANNVGTAGTTPTALLTYLNASAYIDSEGAPLDSDRAMVIEPFTSASIVDSLKGLFMPNEKIAQQYRKGRMGTDSAGMDWLRDQNVVAHTYGSWATTTGTLTADTTGAFTGSISTGWASTSTITLTNSQTLTLNQGDTFTIANVYAVNPQNRQPYGGNKLRNFVVQQTVTATSGTLSVIVSPAIITAGQFQNVKVGTTSSTATVVATSLAGTTATAVVSPQNILLHRNCLTMAMADLEVPRGVHFAGRASDKETGLSIRVVRQYTINDDSLPCRLDVLYGWAPLYPELGCKVIA